MIGQITAVLIAIIIALVNTISVIAQSQNETDEMDIGENQSVSAEYLDLEGILVSVPEL